MARMLGMSALAAPAAMGLTACAGDVGGGPAGLPQPSPAVSATGTPVSAPAAPTAPTASHAAATPAVAGPAPSAGSCYQYPSPLRTGKLVPCPGAP